MDTHSRMQRLRDKAATRNAPRPGRSDDNTMGSLHETRLIPWSLASVLQPPSGFSTVPMGGMQPQRDRNS